MEKQIKGVITDNIVKQREQNVSKQILNCYPVMQAQSQDQPFKAKNLP